MEKLFFTIALIIFTVFSCSSPDTRQNINKVGDAAGQAVGEFVEGVTHGVEKAFDVEVALPQKFADRGIKFGKTMVSSADGGTDNLLLVYMIFETDFNGLMTARAFDNKGLEMGRCPVTVNGKKDEAKFVEFHFDRHTNIDSDSRLTVE